MPAQIAVIDEHGVIEWVNQAWIDFAAENSGSIAEHVGLNYLDVISAAVEAGDIHAKSSLAGIREVIDGTSVDFEHEYPCDSPELRRWFAMRVRPADFGGSRRFIIIHRDISEQHLAEQKIRFSEERLKDFVKSTAERFWETDENHRFVFTSELVDAPDKNPRHSLVGLTPWEAVGATLEDEVWKQHYVALETHEPFKDFLFSRTHRDGRVSYRSTSGVPKFDHNGVFRGYRGTTTDITNQKAAEDKLRESEERYQTVVQNQTELISKFTADGVFTFVNDAYCEYVGQTSDEILGTSIYDAVPKDEIRALQYYFKTFSADLQHQVVENSLKDLKGVARDFEWSNTAILNADGQILEFQSVGRDITTRNIAQRDLEASELRNRSLVELSPDPFLVIDGGLIVFVNPAAVNFFDAPSEDVLLNHSLLNLVQPEFHELARSKREERVVKGQVDFFDLGFITLEGKGVDCEVASVTIPWGESTAGLVLLRDITERKAVETLKSEFVSLVSHELRTPLTSILGSISLVESGTLGPLPTNIADMMTLAKSNSERLVSLVNDILDFEKLQSGGMEFNFVTLDLGSLAEEAIELNQSYADKFNVEFKLRKSRKTLTVKGDKHRLLQVMANLLSNAAKFSNEGDQVLISLKTAKKMARLSVSDKGQGIPEEFQDIIFDRFTQADRGDKRAVKGTGLGLSISKGIIEGHDGLIDFDRTVEKGSTFYFELPLV